MTRVVATMVLTALLFLASGTTASADPEWCDYGSPPSNDFRLRPTGSGSVGSSLGWLASTTGGVLDLANGINTLQGGVATGMRRALEQARPWWSLPQRGYRAAD